MTPPPPAPRRERATTQLVVGLLIMTVGILLMLDRLQLIDITGMGRFWPVGLLAIGVSQWIQGRDARGRFWGTTWIVIGSWLLLNTLDLVQIGFWELFWPLVLVLVGLRLVMHTSRSRAEAARGGDASLFAVMGESKRQLEPGTFQGGQMSAIMGGCRLDLRQASLAPHGEAVIDVFALMGGLELWVPSGWTVVSDDVVPVLGDVKDKRLPPVPPAAGDPDPGPPPRLRLRGQVIMGGLTIKN